MAGKKLHIIFIDFDDIKNPLLSGGQALATFEVAKRLVKLGNRVTVLCSRFPTSHDAKNEGIFYKHIGLGTSNIRVNNAAFFLALPRAVRSLKADVIIECFTAPISTCFSPLYTKIPVIGMPTMFEAEEFAKKYHLPFHWVEAAGTKVYKYFLAYSPINEGKMRRLNPHIYIRRIPNGVSEEYFTVTSKEENYILYIGRIDMVQKGLDLLLKASAKLLKKNTTKIIIAGNGPKDEEEKLSKMIKKLKLSDRVQFIGRIEAHEKERWISRALCGVYPSRFEDFPLVPLEFASMGKPLISFNIEGLAWVPETISVKAKAFKVEELASALNKVSTDKEFRKSLRKGCRAFARNYGWNKISKKYEIFCRDVIVMNRKGITV